MSKNIFLSIAICCFVLCCKDKKDVIKIDEVTQVDINELIDRLTINSNFSVNDVRRYGLMPNQTLGNHPKTKTKIIDEVLNIAEQGQELKFPTGLYKTSLILSNRSNLKLNFDNASFSGSIIVNGTKEKPINHINLKGRLISYSSFSCSFVDDISIDSLIIKNNKDLNISKLESSGCNIYSGTTSLYIDYIEVFGTGSGQQEYRYTPASLMIHGSSPKPYDILLKDVIIYASDRHGAYLSGESIDIENLNINSFAQGTIETLQPIASTTIGDEKLYTGVWLNMFENSVINKLLINTETSPLAVNTIYLDKGDNAFPSYVHKLEIKGKNGKTKIHPQSNVTLPE
jgi:hypothetical protein